MTGIFKKDKQKMSNINIEGWRSAFTININMSAFSLRERLLWLKLKRTPSLLERLAILIEIVENIDKHIPRKLELEFLPIRIRNSLYRSGFRTALDVAMTTDDEIRILTDSIGDKSLKILRDLIPYDADLRKSNLLEENIDVPDINRSKLMSPGQAARELGVSTEWVRKLIISKRLNAIETPLGRLIDSDSVMQFKLDRVKLDKQ